MGANMLYVIAEAGVGSCLCHPGSERERVTRDLVL